MRVLKLKSTSYNKIYFGSDFHLFHNRGFVYAKRNFNTEKEHRDFILADLDKLTSDDLLIYLGDWFLNADFNYSVSIVENLKPTVITVHGNHNSVVKQLYAKYKLEQYGIDDSLDIYPCKINQKGNVILYGDELYLTIDGNSYFCRHMAPLIWENMKYGVPAIIGHSHGSLPGGNPANTVLGKMLDVGVDNAILYNGTSFFSKEDVDKIISKKEQKVHDHHG